MNYIREQLSNIPLLEVFTPEELDRLMPYFELRSFADNTTLFGEGDRGNHVCFVLEGTVDIRKESISGNQQIAAKFGRGSIIGEMSIVDEYPRSATARVTSNSKLLILSRESFDKLTEDLPQLGIRFLKEITRILSQRLRRTSGRFGDIF